MALLAATTGTPISAGRLIAALEALPDERLPEKDRLEAILRQVAVLPAERLAWSTVQLALPQRPYTVIDLDELRLWASRIQRFRFSVGEAAEEPVQAGAISGRGDEALSTPQAAPANTA